MRVTSGLRIPFPSQSLNARLDKFLISWSGSGEPIATLQVRSFLDGVEILQVPDDIQEIMTHLSHT